MKQIFKYPLKITDEQKVHMPQGAQILTAQMQHGNLCLWAVVDNDNDLPSTPRVVRIFGTGHYAPDIEGLRYIGTVQESALVWHVFEK